ncbi:MAG: ABC transporter substrate-binding protein [Proteobacteria bacterium]|nr:ABC transporter substrate-binding protein [Pseudomonadota bacterium]
MRLAHSCYVACLLGALLGAHAADAAPQRVVSTFLCTDEYVYRMVPRGRIAALSYLSADRHPVVSTIADKVKGIRLTRGSAEEVLALHPDLVVMYRGTNPRLKAQLVQTHTPLLEVKWANSLADIRDVTRTLGKAFGAEKRANAMIAAMDAKLARAAKHAPYPPVRTLIYEPNGYANSGGVSDDILRRIGLIDVAPRMNQTRSGTVPVEAVIANPPELLILNGEREATPTRADLVLKHPALRALPKSTLVANTSLTPLLCAGPWSADVAEPLMELGRKARSLASPPHTN